MLAALAAIPLTISFSHSAVPLRVLIPELAEATHVQLKVDPALEWRVLYIRTQNVTPSELLQEVARASLGAWGTEGKDRLVLVPDQAVIRKAADELREHRARLLKENYTANRASDQINKLFSAALVDAFGVDGLAGIELGRGIAYSNAPTAAQRPLPQFPRWFIDKLLANENAERAKSAAWAEANRDQLTQADYEKIMARVHLDAIPERAILRINASTRSSINALLTLYDGDGSPEISISSATSLMAHHGPPDPPPPLYASEEPLVMPDGILTALDLKKGGKVVREAILGIGDRDLLLKTVTAYLDVLTKPLPANLVMAVPDYTLGCAEPGLPHGVMLTGFVRNAKVTTRSGWMTLSPDGPVRPTNRALLREAIARVSVSEPSFEDWAWVAANYGAIHDFDDWGHLFDDFCRWLRIKQAYFGGRQQDDNPLLKVYGMMTPDQQILLRSGGAVRVAEMTKEQRRIIDAVPDDSDGFTPNVIAEMRMRSDLTPTQTDWVRKHISESRRYENQLTVRMPTGCPGSARMSLTQKEDHGKVFELRLDAGYFGIYEPHRMMLRPEDGG